MQKRRRWLQAAVLGGLAALQPWNKVRAQEGFSTNSAERLDQRSLVSLEDQLKNGLRAVTPGQVRYIKTVVAAVERGQLPRAMVNLVYRWAIQRNSRVPFPYFQYALRVLAQKRGIQLR